MSLRWTPQGRRNRGRPKETRRRTIDKDLKARGTAPNIAADRSNGNPLPSPYEPDGAERIKLKTKKVCNYSGQTALGLKHCLSELWCFGRFSMKQEQCNVRDVMWVKSF